MKDNLDIKRNTKSGFVKYMMENPEYFMDIFGYYPTRENMEITFDNLKVERLIVGNPSKKCIYAPLNICLCGSKQGGKRGKRNG